MGKARSGAGTTPNADVRCLVSVTVPWHHSCGGGTAYDLVTSAVSLPVIPIR